ncbi:related to transposase [Sporisorium reilianum SRZ2]|uniref:Related to transposase n=1 Tax=Sporisorium reilianum (strain SRZ2) TaxID=999809 RepID=E6ZYH6_SPORE|nr:related to transposase [Sporisorium reilianum SRZ2]
MRPISPQKRREALRLLQNGQSTHQVAEQVGISKSMVSNIRKAAPTQLPTPKSGRKKSLAPVMLLGSTNSSAATPRQRCHFRARKIINKPLLTIRHKKARLAFALAHKDWTVDDWKTVICSDECKINRIGSDGRQHCWINAAGFNSKLVHPTVKFGGGSIMVWGSMTHKGVGAFHILKERMTAVIYIAILEAHLLPVLRTVGFFNDNTNAIFQQDGDPKHKAKVTMQWFRQNHIRLLDWPAQSPDLNPIEHLWTELKKRLGQYKEHPTWMLELEGRLEEVWAQIPVSLCQALVESMPKRIEAVIKARGGNTKY